MAIALGDHIKGHVLRFDARAKTSVGAETARCLVLIFFVLEIVIGPRMHFFGILNLPVAPHYVNVPILLVTALFLVSRFTRLAQIGLYPWREWSMSEKSYFLQIVVAINVVFAVLYRARIEAIVDWRSAAVVFAAYFVWGFYQEVMYRGILQTALVERWGVWPGIIVTNLLFTFGPLHLYHLAGDSPAPMFFSIFAIGMFFGALRQRSGNLWIVAVFHGIGDCYFTALGTMPYSSSP